ncbi:MAG: hypothetical protein M3Y79_16200 [Pseudomonadota bacterium]|nr:hypothetical protein [Pseudomonadota bacterium]
MISINRSSSLAAVALAGMGIGIAGCDSIKDVRSEPATTVPEQMAVLEGTITGLGNKRPVRLNAGITREGYEPIRYFFGNLDIPATPFSYGSIPVGTPYNFSITQNPFGKVCTVQNGSGTVGGTGPLPSVSCVDDPALPRYTISGTAVSSFANLPGAAVSLSTEEGVERIELGGATAFTFTTRGFNAPISNPTDPAASQFLWNVIATYQQDGRTYNCRVLNGAGANPTADVTNVNVDTCLFTVTGTVQYSAPAGGSAQSMGADGLKLALQKLGTAEPPANSELTISGFSGSTIDFWTQLPSYVGAAYDIVVTQNPAGQKCIVSTFAAAVPAPGPLTFGTTAVAGAAQGSALWLSNPPATGAASSHTWNPNGVSVRCRALPTAEKVLTGVYQRIQRNTATTPVINNRQFLALFDDGTFLFATHADRPLNIGTGVEHGFYDYNPVAGTIEFTLHTDSSVIGGRSNLPWSLSNTPGFTGVVSSAAGGRTVPATVVKGGDTLTLTFVGPTATAAGSPNVTSTLEMVEPKTASMQMMGPWISEDYRRLFVYNFDTGNGFHAGVNGPAQVQDACYTYPNTTETSGYYIRRTSCITGPQFAQGFAFVDNAGSNGATYPPGFIGALPGSQSVLDTRSPSPNLFEILPGNPEVLLVEMTDNGEPIDEPPHRFIRAQIN